MTRRVSDYFEGAKGIVDFFVHRDWASGFGGPFNGQEGRRQVFAELLRTCPFSAVVETGTYRGTTTEFMSEASGLPVYSAELHGRPFAFAFLRLLGRRNVHLFWEDSRNCIEGLRMRKELENAWPFVYLDAHWNEDFPLADEINLIFATWPRSVVMIDDFKVPGDDGYAFDSYGPGKTLSLEYVDREARFELTAFFPRLSSEEESGSKRGCVVLAREEASVGRLRQCASLRDGGTLGRAR